MVEALRLLLFFFSCRLFRYRYTLCTQVDCCCCGQTDTGNSDRYTYKSWDTYRQSDITERPSLEVGLSRHSDAYSLPFHFQTHSAKYTHIYIFIYLYIYIHIYIYIYINFSFRFSYYYSRKKFFFFGTLLPTQFPPIPLCIIYSCTHLHMLPVFPNSIWHLYCFFFLFAVCLFNL